MSQHHISQNNVETFAWQYEKMEKKLTAKKYVIVCALPETEDRINSFQVKFPSLYCLKASANLYFLIFFTWLEREHCPEIGKL